MGGRRKIMTTSRRYRRTGELPGTVRRSCREAQALFTTAHEHAAQTHGEGDQAYRAAFTVLKQKFEKRGDHWIPKRDSDQSGQW
jgi:ChaB